MALFDFFKNKPPRKEKWKLLICNLRR